MYKSFLKRTLDIIFAFFALIIFAPLLLIITFLVLIFVREFPFFLQERTGQNGKPFMIYKFKTMRTLRNSDGEMLHDELRTNAGSNFLRRINLDELPQLLNILRGEMSFIGPRPFPVRYESIYSKNQFRRHLVRPGVSGLAQVSGRRSVSWKKRIELDLDYVENLSLKMDFVIFLRTFRVLFDTSKSEFAIDQDPENYMPNFNE